MSIKCIKFSMTIRSQKIMQITGNIVILYNIIYNIEKEESSIAN